MSERQEFKVGGRVVGTGTGWDDMGDYSLQIYDLEPADALKARWPAGGVDLFVNYDEGVLEVYDQAGVQVLAKWDLVDVLVALNG